MELGIPDGGSAGAGFAESESVMSIAVNPAWWMSSLPRNFPFSAALLFHSSVVKGLRPRDSPGIEDGIGAFGADFGRIAVDCVVESGLVD